jgi:hypothetical protein
MDWDKRKAPNPFPRAGGCGYRQRLHVAERPVVYLGCVTESSLRDSDTGVVVVEILIAETWRYTIWEKSSLACKNGPALEAVADPVPYRNGPRDLHPEGHQPIHPREHGAPAR